MEKPSTFQIDQQKFLEFFPASCIEAWLEHNQELFPLTIMTSKQEDGEYKYLCWKQCLICSEALSKPTREKGSTILKNI
jgi:hypothetical protein